MKFNFRQGIQKAPIVSGSPSFLEYNSGNNTITVVVGVEMVRATIAYESINYLVEERENIASAWGPLNWNTAWGPIPVSFTSYLYWDINVATGHVTRGFTPRAPIYSETQPVSPANDQHWFDLASTTMKVWDGVRWSKKLRVFAGSYNGGLGTVEEQLLGSQAGLTYVGSQANWPDHGYILYGIDMKGIKNSDGSFVTTATPVNTFHGSFSSPIRLELASSTAIAAEPIGAFYAVTSNADGTISLASSDDQSKWPIGIISVPADEDEPVDVITHGVVFNDQWLWDANDGKFLFCGPTGELVQSYQYSQGAPRVGVIIDAHTILVDIDLYGIGEPGEPGEPGPANPECIIVACSDEVTPIETGNSLVTFRIPYDFELTDVKASLSVALTSEGPMQVTIRKNGSSILSTNIRIDPDEKTSRTASTQPVISDGQLAEDDEITVDVSIGGTAAGLKVYLIGVKPQV